MGKRVSQDVAIKRREIVSALRRRGMTLDEIVAQMSDPYVRINENGTERMLDEIVAQMSDPYVRINENGTERMLDNPVYTINPQSGDPFDRSTIARDLDYLRKLANERAAQSAEDHRAELLDRFEELYRIAMKQQRYREAREILTRIARLTGANRPEKIEHSVNEEQLGKIDRMKSLFQMMRQQEAEHGNGTTD